jgi:hypothetical protein
MAWYDNVGKMAKSFADFTGVPGLIHDMATSGSNDDPWYVDGINLVKDVAKIGTTPVRGAVKGLFYVGEKSYEAGGIARRGITNGLIESPLMYNKFKNKDESYEDYRLRVDAKKDNISLGQATLSLLSPGKNSGELNPHFDNDFTARNFRFLSSGFDLFNPEDRKTAFEDQYTGKFISGVQDLAASTVIDPLSVTGFFGKGAVIISKGVMAENINGKLARAMFGKFTTNDTIARDIDKGLEFIKTKGKSGSRKAADDIAFLAESDASQQAGYWAKKKVTNPDAMAFLFGKTKNPEEVVQTYRAVLGKDPKAIALLAEKDSEIGLVLDNLNQVPHPHRELMNGNLEGDVLVSPEYNAAMGNYVADMIKNPRYRAALDQVATGREIREGFGIGLARGSAIKAAKVEAHRAFSEPAVTILQKTSLHPAIRVITKPVARVGEYFREERPSGVFHVNDADSYREFNTFLREANDLSGKTFGTQAKDFADQYLTAVTEGDRRKIILEAERSAINHLFGDYGYSQEQLDKIYTLYDSRRAAGIQKMRDQGFISHFNGDQLNHSVHLPVVQSESANTVIIADLRKLKFGIDAHRRVLPTLLDGMDVEALNVRGLKGMQSLDTINDIFKTSVLMRLGYTVRNLTEAQLSMMAKGFALPSMVAANGKEGVARFFNNRKVGFERLGDHVNVMTGKVDDIRVMQQEFAHEADKLRSIDMSRQQLAKAISERIGELQADRFNVRKTLGDGSGPLEPSDEVRILQGALDDLNSVTIYHGSPESFNLDPKRALVGSTSNNRAAKYAEGGVIASVEQYIPTKSGRPGRLGQKPELAPGAEIGTSGVAAQMPLNEFNEVKQYVRGFYAETQLDLRNPYREGEYIKQDIPPRLQRAIQRSVIKENTVVFRGTSNPDILKAKVGDVITEKGFTSASKEYRIAEKFAAADKNGTIIRIQLPKGANGLDITSTYKQFAQTDKELALQTGWSDAVGEAEVLLPAETKFEVVGMIEGKPGDKDFLEIPPVFTLRAIVKEPPTPSPKRTDVVNEATLRLQSDMIDAVNAGKLVEYKDSVGQWKKVKSIDYDTLVLAADTDEAEVVLFKNWSNRPVFRVGYSKGKVEPYRVYGKPLHMTNWNDIPVELRDSAFDGKKSNYREWIKSKGWQETDSPVFKYMRDNGYGRAVVLDDARAGGVSHVALPEAIGKDGRTREVDTNLKAIMAKQGEAMDWQVATDFQPKFTTPEERRAAKRRAIRRERSGVNDLAVSPYYTKDNVQSMINNGVVDAAENLSRDYAFAHAHLDDMATRVNARVSRAETMAVKQRLGYGTMNIEAGGINYELPKVFEEASWFLGRTSAEQTWNAMVASQEMAFTAGIGSRTVRLVEPNDPRYYEGWANILNMHFRNPETGVMDPLVRQMLDGKSDEQLLRWFRTNEGSLYANNTYTRIGQAYGFTKLKGGELDEELLEKIQITRGAVKAYIPDEETALMLAAATDAEKPLTGAQVQEFLVNRFKDAPEKLTPLNGLLVTTSKEYKDQERLIDTINRRVMRFLGSMPEDVFARHPLVSAVYEKELRLNMAALADAKGSEKLTGDEVNRAVRSARERSRQEVERTLFTIVRRTGASSSQVMRLLFPFYAAFENTAKRWGGMLAEDPAIAANAARTIAQVVNGQLVVDRDGNEITDATKIQGGNANLVVRVPQGFIDSMPKSWRPIIEDSFKNINIPLSSLDVITQGQVGNPGFGPFAVLPAYLILKQQPSLEKAMEPFFPAGMPQSAMDLFTPSVLRRMNTVWTKNDLYVRTYNQMLRYETYRFNQGERTDSPTVKEIQDRTNKFYFLRALTSVAMPFAVSPEMDFYQQTFRQFQTQYANYKDPVTGKPVYGKAEAEFLKMYPDFFEATVSLSKNEGGLEPSLGVVQNLKKHSNLMALATAKGDPELMGFLADDKDGQYTFSQAAYQWQYNHGAAPGSGSAYRKNRPAGEILVDANVKRGWTEYQKMQTAITSYRLQNGITDDKDPQMNIVKEAKSLWIKEMAKTNLDWYSTYSSPDRAKYARRAEIMKTALKDKNWMADNGDRTVVKNIALYLEARDAIGGLLDQRDAAGGSRSLTAKANADVAQALDIYTTQLMKDSPEFEQFINRYFANDSVVI